MRIDAYEPVRASNPPSSRQTLQPSAMLPSIDRRHFIARAAWGVSAAGLIGGWSGTMSAQSPTRRPTVIGAAPGVEAVPGRIGFDLPETHRWRIGLNLRTGSSLRNVTATFPIPVAWPEQEVRVVTKNVDPGVAGWTTRVAPGGTTQVLLRMPKVAASTNVTAMFEFDVTKSRIVAPEKVDDLVVPVRPSREVKIFLGTSPEIDTTHRLIREAYQEVTAEPHENAWSMVEGLYDHVRDNVRYVNGAIQKASDALKSGQGDCEEMTSLVVALCRNAKIPARMVWVPEHCYPEFYLEDGEGNGHWFPAQAAGTRQFGGIEEYRPILQKGDRFRVPEKGGKPQRYLTEFFTCEVKGKVDPAPEFVLERVAV